MSKKLCNKKVIRILPNLKINIWRYVAWRFKNPSHQNLPIANWITQPRDACERPFLISWTQYILYCCAILLMLSAGLCQLNKDTSRFQSSLARSLFDNIYFLLWVSFQPIEKTLLPLSLGEFLQWRHLTAIFFFYREQLSVAPKRGGAPGSAGKPDVWCQSPECGGLASTF